MSRALLVIDVQNEYFTGALPITHPVGHLERILEVIDAAAGRIPTVVVQHHSEDRPIFRRGSKEWELHPEVAARPRDLLIEKSVPGSFTNTPLDGWLRERGITTVSIAGYMTHMCCDATARQAVHRGFKSEFLSDATGTLSLSNAGGKVTAEELQRSILAAQAQLLSEVLPSSEWIGRCEEAWPPGFWARNAERPMSANAGIGTSVAPMLSVRNGARAVEFYKAAFGATEVFRIEDPSGAVVARLSVDGAEFWLADESPEHGNFSPETLGGGTVRMLLTVPDPDASFARALAAGAREVVAVKDDYGWRLGRVADPFGHHWEIGHPLDS